MGIFNLVIIVPLLAIYGICGAICLRILGIKTNILTLSLFVLGGVLAGTISIFIYGFLVADQNGQLNGAIEVIGMFGISGLVALFASVLSVKLAMKYNMALKRDRTNRAAP